MNLAFIGFRHGHIMGLYHAALKHPAVKVVAAVEEDPAAASALKDKVAFTHTRMSDVLPLCDAVAVGDYFSKRGSIIIAALTVLVRLRTLTFSAMTANVDGVVSVMSRFEPFRPAAQDARHLFGLGLQYWPVLLMVYAMFSIMIVTLVGWWALSRVLDRLRLWLAMDEAERARQIHTPVMLHDRGWRME